MDTVRQVAGKILVVDDDANMQTFLNKFLTSEGHHVTTCSSATEGMEKLSSENSNADSQESAFDLVLTDVNMPEMNGHSLLKEVKERYPSLPVVMITAFG